jgi:DNA invertase Pin-like site-specific DNA recombinase
MKPAIAYARVSTEKQGYSGLGLDAQLVQITQFAADSGYEIVDPPFLEVASATGAHSMRKRTKLGAAIVSRGVV